MAPAVARSKAAARLAFPLFPLSSISSLRLGVLASLRSIGSPGPQAPFTQKIARICLCLPLCFSVYSEPLWFIPFRALLEDCKQPPGEGDQREPEGVPREQAAELSRDRPQPATWE